MRSAKDRLSDEDLALALQKARCTDPLDVRMSALELWRARAEDAHRKAKLYDTLTPYAALALAAAMICLAAMGIMLI